MSKLTTYRFARAATIKLVLGAVSGDPEDVAIVTARLRKLPDDGRVELEADDPVAATFAVEAREATVDIPAGWSLVITDEISTGLSVGAYLTDARLGVGSDFETTNSVRIEIYEPATVS